MQTVVTNTMHGLTLEPEKTLGAREWQTQLECFGPHTPTLIRPSLRHPAKPMSQQLIPLVPTRLVALELWTKDSPITMSAV
jgi:hypothetical protein